MGPDWWDVSALPLEPLLAQHVMGKIPTKWCQWTTSLQVISMSPLEFSNDRIQLKSPQQELIQHLPMRVDPAIPADVGWPDVSPISSTISKNPLLRSAGPNERTPSPRRHTSTSVHTCDSNKAHAVMEGLIPIGEGFRALGYAPVGGVTYKIHFPRAEGSGRGKSDNDISMRSRRLFADYTSMVEAGPHDPLVAGYHPALCAILQDVHIHSRISSSYMHNDLHIVRSVESQSFSDPNWIHWHGGSRST